MSLCPGVAAAEALSKLDITVLDRDGLDAALLLVKQVDGWLGSKKMLKRWRDRHTGMYHLNGVFDPLRGAELFTASSAEAPTPTPTPAPAPGPPTTATTVSHTTMTGTTTIRGCGRRTGYRWC